MRKIMTSLSSGFIACIVLTVTGCASVEDAVFDAGMGMERALAGMKGSSVTVQGRTIAYLERPGKGETIVLLHGFGADKDNWPRFVRRLPKQYRVIAFDLPGHGSSFKDADAVYTIDFITRGLADAIDALKLERFHLAGNSMGGWVGAIYTAGHPDRVTTLALLDAAGTQSPEKSDMGRALEQGVNILVPSTEKEYSDLLGYAFNKRPFIPWPATDVLARRAVAEAPFRRKMFTDIHREARDVKEVLPELNLPVLIIWGARDRIIHVSAARVFEYYLPKSETVIMQDCGHMPMLERPEETAACYSSFIERHATPAP
jgi:pimeloyl-ACP methyl ester carboxylesterase